MCRTDPNPVTHIDHNVGILAMEVYTSHQYVAQSELEAHEGVSAGKFTIGLGQKAIALTGDREDINSICLTVVHRLLEKYDIDPSDVGRLEVGTETLVDKSKSTKTVLMQLFGDNTDIEGATVLNACYGGTAALFNAMTWCDSNAWDGRYAIVVTGDIAAYAKGPARPTGGLGACAMLVGRDAPLACDLRLRATHCANAWDFYKPDPTVEYATVNGALSQVCYYQALESVYQGLAKKIEKFCGGTFDATEPDHFVFHSPYNKLVQKSYARLFNVDARRGKDIPELKDWVSKPIESTYTDKALEKVLKTLSQKDFKEKMADANYCGELIGNAYTASVFCGLASLVDRAGSRKELTDGKSIIMFSYGSGSLASMYRLQVREPTSAHAEKFSIASMVSNLKLTERLDERVKVNAQELDLALSTRAKMHKAGAPYQPIYPTEGSLLPGTYYLKEMDEQWCRRYERIPLDGPAPASESLAPKQILEAEQENGIQNGH